MGNATSKGTWDWSAGQPQWKPAVAAAPRRPLFVARDYSSSDDNNNWFIMRTQAERDAARRMRRAAAARRRAAAATHG